MNPPLEKGVGGIQIQKPGPRLRSTDFKAKGASTPLGHLEVGSRKTEVGAQIPRARSAKRT
jgi:hypothetical protein